jgi:hypothetical protein
MVRLVLALFGIALVIPAGAGGCGKRPSRQGPPAEPAAPAPAAEPGDVATSRTLPEEAPMTTAPAAPAARALRTALGEAGARRHAGAGRRGGRGPRVVRHAHRGPVGARAHRRARAGRSRRRQRLPGPPAALRGPARQRAHGRAARPLVGSHRGLHRKPAPDPGARRDLDGDFGEDLLARHLRAHPHPSPDSETNTAPGSRPAAKHDTP